ncbi:hypothetical protein NQZ68_033598 [Dissostichus eleginoides]|nr:hypothetical protein NQZ68_033598 [Dissostichus eleginoides]
MVRCSRALLNLPSSAGLGPTLDRLVEYVLLYFLIRSQPAPLLTKFVTCKKQQTELETQQPNFGALKAESGGRERASPRTWTEGEQLLKLSHVKWST